MMQIGRWPQMGQRKWWPLRLLAMLAAVLALQPRVEVAAAATTALPGGAVIYVDDSAVAGANNGSSWSNAFTDLQDALKIAQAGDEIRIGQGVYKPAPPGGDRTISFNLVSGVVMQGGYAGFGAPHPDAVDFEKFVTVLSGDLNGNDAPFPQMAGLGDNAYHVLGADGVDADTILRGVIITSGHAGNQDGIGHESAGGLRLMNAASPVVDHCVFRHHRAWSGTAVYAQGGAPVFTHCRFLDNRSLSYGNTSGGALVVNGPVVIRDCEFVGNTGGASAGAIDAHPLQGIIQRCKFVDNGAESGGAIRGGQFVVDCVFIDNSGATDGGGAAEDVDTMINCLFLGNYGERGGAIRHVQRLINCVFIGNESYTSGSAILSESDTTIINCTFIANRVMVQPSGAIALEGGADITISNSILWGNSSASNVNQASQIDLGNGSVAIHNSCIQGWTGTLGGTGNHGNDPRFVDADGPDNIYGTADDDPRLRANSPCIDSGDSALLPPDQFDLDEDGDFTEPLPIDLDGLPRVVGASVDIGAFEFQGTPCRADIDGSGAVNVTDLLAIINAWGPCTRGQQCNSDLNLNNQVDVPDLLAVILQWGVCP